MASSKRLGLFLGDDKVTLVEFEKNGPVQVVISPLGSKTNKSSPFSSNLTEEIQITAILKKMLLDNQIKGGAFYVSLPLKEIILRSFVIPFVKQGDIYNAVKFEAKRYVPFEIQDLSYVFHTIPFTEGQNKRLQVIFFAARKEVLSRYERIAQQINIEFNYSEPYMVSLAKSLLFRKEIKPADNLAFLVLDKNLGSICFIDSGVPQFIREFPISSPSQSEETNESQEVLNLKIVNEVGNSFDFYGRQFSGDRINQVLVSSETLQKDLLDILEAELKLKVIKFSPVINTVRKNQSSDMDAIYAMGACVSPPLESLSKFNFMEDKVAKPGLAMEIFEILKPYKKTIFALLMCVSFLTGVYVFFLTQLKLVQNQYNRLSAQEGAYASETQDSVQAELQQNIDKLNQYKNIRTKSDVVSVILRVASHLPKGTLLTSLSISYSQGDSNNEHMNIDIQGMVVNGAFTEQIAVVNQVFADLKNDKELLRFINDVSLVSLNRAMYNDKEATGFVVHCS